MTNRRRKGKRHRPFDPVPSTMFITPMPPQQREMLLATFRAALQMMATSSQAGPQEFRDLSDVVNTVETLAVELHKLDPEEVQPTIDAAIQALAEAAKRWHAGARMGLSGPGLQALRDIIDIYAQCAEGLTGMEMAKARLLTQERTRQVLAGKVPKGREVIAV